jgi:hypothetical protein
LRLIAKLLVAHLRKKIERIHFIHTVIAWSYQHQLVLGQTEVSEKSNETNAISELLSMLDIENSIVTLDAMGCQRATADQIIKQKVNYVLALIGNHSGIQAVLEAWWHKSEREALSEGIFKKIYLN